MCGRYQFFSPEEAVRRLFAYAGPPANLAPRYNIAPTQDAPVVVLEAGVRRLRTMRWGLIPSWAKDMKIGYSTINARSETAAEKPAFRAAFRRRRCLVPADGFYEWQEREGGRKQPWRIHVKAGLCGFAGLWERWEGGTEGAVESFTILTTAANALVAEIHAKKRMPAILRPSAYAAWLDPDTDPAVVRGLAGFRYPEEEMAAYRVGMAVNAARTEGPQCIEPVTD